MLDPERFGKEMGELIADAVRPLKERIAELESKPSPTVELSTSDVLEALKSDPGFMRDVVESYIKENPPADGKDGVGLTGAMIDGEGDLVVTLSNGSLQRCGRVRPSDGFLRGAVSDYLKENPPPAGPAGPAGKDGAPGAEGKDGASLTGAMVNRDGELILTLGDGSLHKCGNVVGKDGKDLTELNIDYDGARKVTIKAGSIVKEINLPGLIDRGFWREGMKASPGDGYTHDGSYWICQKETSAKPANGDDWRLAVRKGRDGK